MRKISIFLALLVLLTAAGRAPAEEGNSDSPDRIAWIDLPRVMKEYRRAGEMVEAFEEEKAAREAEVKEMVAEIERMEGEMLLLSEQARKARQEEILRKKLGVNAMIEEAEEELARQSVIRQKRLLDDISLVAERIALRRGYSFILRGEVLIFQDPGREITDEVIEELNRGGEEKERE